MRDTTVTGPRYNFGVYHWRRRFVRIAVATVGVLFAYVLGRGTRNELTKPCAVAIAFVASRYGLRTVRRLLSPLPWVIERHKYDALAASLPYDRATVALDVGCGTGRSLVGLAPHVPDDVTMCGLDVFDARVILGNGPHRAKRNAEAAGLSVTPIIGDAAVVPIASNSVDVVTFCRVLHDLTPPRIESTLRECNRICAPDARIGILELPIVPDSAAQVVDPVTYWSNRVRETGFELEQLYRVDRRRGGDPYVLIVARPTGGERARESAVAGRFEVDVDGTSATGSVIERVSESIASSEMDVTPDSTTDTGSRW